MKFTACKHLDFSDNYHNCKKQILACGKLFWLRDVSYDSSLPSMVQFCKLRGRLNEPTACIYPENAKCSDYVEFEHDIEYPGIQFIDLDKSDWERIQKAAAESEWMPPDYTRNDWVNDVCRYLKEK